MVRFCDRLILKTGYLPGHLISPFRRCHELRSAARIGGSFLGQSLKTPGIATFIRCGRRDLLVVGLSVFDAARYSRHVRSYRPESTLRQGSNNT
jgi:hypothetical protein